MKYPEVTITKDELRKIIYFILMKFRADPLHRSGTSSKRDLIGGYIERWFNKIAETIIFDELLKSKNYRVVSDYFIYANDSEKNAPDILGIKTNLKTIPFVKYVDGSWVTMDGMPRIEVKVVRKDQYLVGIREPQMVDDYYAFIESNLDEEYLSSIFDRETFHDKYFDQLEMSEEFIQSDVDHQIIDHLKVIQSEKIGTLRLIGVYTKEEIRENSILCSKDVSPYYFSTASNKKPKSKAIETTIINLDDKGRFNYKYNQEHFCLPVAIDKPENTIITITKSNKGSVYLNSSHPITIGGIALEAGDILVEFKKFERSSKWDENILLKQTLEYYGQDSTDAMVHKFDVIASNHV